MKSKANVSRRQLLKGSLGAIGFLASSSALARTLAQSCGGATPPQTEGPFYPIEDQLDKDSDLTFVSNRFVRAKGQVIYVKGQVLDDSCVPVADALVEIWQACESGKYNHPNDPNTADLDPNFQYWGQAVTDADGMYLFKTILPGAYPADTDWIRPPHIHYKVHKRGFHELTTQLYFDRFADLNAQDKILRAIPSAERSKVIAALAPSDADLEKGSMMCRFDIGITKIR